MSASNDVLNSEANTSEAPTASVPAHRIYRAGTGVRQKLDALGSGDNPPSTLLQRDTFRRCGGARFVLWASCEGREDRCRVGVRKIHPVLYADRYGHPRRIDFLAATENDLVHLAGVCEPATFGVNQQDVLDLTYRTALKLDTKFFAPKLT